MSNEINWSEKKAAIEKEHGPWTAHNIDLGGDLFTLRPGEPGDALKLQRVLQIVSDNCGGRIDELRVLDLACLEGLYGTEFATRGAQVCAIEGREQNLEKARFAAQALGLDTIEFHQDDVRNLSEEKYGLFDVVLCLGILYHLDVPDVFDFLERIFSICQGLVIIDTHISLLPHETFQHNGKEYWGRTVFEHEPDASEEEKKSNLWASLDNPSSVHLTQPSLCNLLSHLGFSSVYECFVPEEPTKPANRVTLLAIKGQRLTPGVCPQWPDGFARELPEPEIAQPEIAHELQWRPSLRAIGSIIPQQIKDIVKSTLLSEQ